MPFHALAMVPVAMLLSLLIVPANADPRPAASEGWKTDFTRHSVPLREIKSAGPPKDGIPAIDKPLFRKVADEKQLDDREPVIALTVNGETRAYPLRILMWHEIANDTIGGRQVTVTYCPLCNASIVFDAELDGRKLDFGTTGRLRNSDLVMYDRQTESWWQQFTGEAIIGELTGARLTMLPSTTVPWRLFRTRFPDAQVLIPNNPEMRRYGANPYAFYDTSERPFLYDGSIPQGVAPMDRVVIVELEDGPWVIRMEALRQGGTASKGGVTIRWQAGMASALDSREITEGRDTGHVSVTRDSDGEELAHHVTFAFVAEAFHPGVAIEGKAR